VAKVPQARWNRFLEQHAQYHSYQLKVAGDFVLSTLSLVAIITGLFLGSPKAAPHLLWGSSPRREARRACLGPASIIAGTPRLFINRSMRTSKH
jgi:hypothetical protein